MVFSHQAMTHAANTASMFILKNFTTQIYKRTNGNEINTSLQVAKPRQRFLIMRQVNLIASYTSKKKPGNKPGFCVCSSKNYRLEN
jgi:hypothetical protein